VREGERKLHEAILAWKDAQIATLQASIEWRDTWDTQLELQNEEVRVSLERQISLLERMNETNEKAIGSYLGFPVELASDLGWSKEGHTRPLPAAGWRTVARGPLSRSLSDVISKDELTALSLV
jgi:hypothetical protein